MFMIQYIDFQFTITVQYVGRGELSLN